MDKQIKKTMKVMKNERSRLMIRQLCFIFLALVLWHCPRGDSPVSDLSSARLHLSAAQEEGGHKHNPKNYNKARDNLLKAHDFLAEEEFSKVKVEAQSSLVLSIALREQVAPGHTAGLEKRAQASIASLKKINTKEKAAQELESLQLTYDKAKQYHDQADQEREQNHKNKVAISPKNQEAHARVLEKYRGAYLSYQQVIEQAKVIEKEHKAQSLSLADAFKAAQAELKKAKLYGAKNSELSPLKSKLNKAKQRYQKKDYNKASGILEELNGEIAALITRLKPVYAKTMLKKAKASIAKAEKLQTSIDNQQNRQNEKKAKSLEAIKDQLSSAKEAEKAASSFLEQKNYDESIAESKDAIRLSQVIFEQGRLIASNRSVQITRDGYGEVEDIGGGWKRYVVRDKKPADCLWCIAARAMVYGKGELWTRIYKANRKAIKNPGLIYPKQVLFIPPREGAFSEPPKPSDQLNPSSVEEQSKDEASGTTEPETTDDATTNETKADDSKADSSGE